MNICTHCCLQCNSGRRSSHPLHLQTQGPPPPLPTHLAYPARRVVIECVDNKHVYLHYENSREPNSSHPIQQIESKLYTNKIYNNASVNGNDKLVRSDFFLELKLLQVAFEEEITAHCRIDYSDTE